MRKRCWMMFFGFALLTTGCSARDHDLQVEVKTDTAMTTWEVEDTFVSAPLPAEPGDVTEEGITPEDLTIEANILAITEVTAEEGELPTSRLVTGKDYKVLARVLLAADTEVIVGQKLYLALTCPTVVEKGKTADITIKVLANDGTDEENQVLVENQFAVTTTAYDLAVAYMPLTFVLYQNEHHAQISNNDELMWYAAATQQTLLYPIMVKESLGIYEYTAEFAVHTEVLESDRLTADEQAQQPLKVKVLGTSLQAGETEVDARRALEDCLRADYLVPETLPNTGVTYVVTEVILPEWAREYTEEYGLTLTLYNYLTDSICGVSAELPNYPDNVGYAEDEVNTVVQKTDGHWASLATYPTTPLTIWQEQADGSWDVVATLKYVSDHSYDPARDRACLCLVMEGELIQQVGEKFYLVAGSEVATGKISP